MSWLLSAAAIACGALVGIVVADTASAHSAHPRPRIGASHLTPSGAPEDWGTYCVTELAPLFRDAIAYGGMQVASASTDLPAAQSDASAPGHASAGSAPPPIPLLDPIPPSLMDEPEAKTGGITVFVARRIVNPVVSTELRLIYRERRTFSKAESAVRDIVISAFKDEITRSIASGSSFLRY